MKFFPENLLTEVEFHKILEKISEFTDLEPAKQQILNIKPSENVEEIKTEFLFLQEIEAATNLYPAPQAPEKLEIIKRKINNNAEFLNFEEIIPMLKWVIDYRNWFDIIENKDFKLLKQELNLREDAENLLLVLTEFFTEDAKWKPHIHAVFKKLEDKISETQAQLHSKIRRIIKKLRNKGYTDADSFTIRNNRLVIPVHSQYKSYVKGIFHDVSNTGLTIYIEPEETTELQNKLGFLKMKLNNEIRKVLVNISEKLYNQREHFNNLYELQIFIEIATAKLKWQELITGNIPTISSEVKVKLTNARNPYLILQKGYENVVPFDIYMDTKTRIIVISGPNAGGKSITLKAVLLNILLFQSAIPIPVGQSSELFVFEKIFADIGDRQSAEEELSTYSAKLKFLNNLIQECNTKSIFFIDEFGSGTAPEFGGAIARSFLEQIINKKCLGVITTHYEIIKAFAQENPNLVNSAMEFDLQELKPTYKFIQNKTGRSFALEIANRIGTAENIIERAKQFINKNVWNAEKILIEARQKEQELQKLIQHQQQLNQQLRKEISKLKEKKQKLSEEKDKIIRQTQVKANKIISELTKDLKQKRSAKKIAEKLSQEIREIKKEIPEEIPETKELKVGDFVRIKGSTSVGKINRILGDEAEVIIGNIRMLMPLDDLIPASAQKEIPVKKKTPKIITNVSNKIDLRGLTSEEAIPELDKWLNKLITANIKRAEIIHGKGTFSLRNNIRKFLREHYSEFFKYYDGDNEGITIIELR